MRKYTEKLYVISIIGLIFTIYGKEFFRINFPLLNTALLVMVVITGIILARGLAFYMSLLGLIVGHILFFIYDMSFAMWLNGLTKNLPLAILFIMVPFLSIPLREGGYLETINYYISKYSNRTCGLFTVLSSFVFALGSITNLGSLRITHSLLEKIKFPPKFLAKIYGVGFSSCIAWSPYFGSVNLVLYYTGVSFSRYFVFGLFYGILVLTIGNILFYKDLACQREVYSSMVTIEEIVEDNSKIRQLLLILIGLFIVVIIGETTLNFSSTMYLISLIAVIYSVFWSLLIKKFEDFLQALKQYNQTMVQVGNELIFFLSVGFFGVVLANTPLQNIIESFFKGISGFSIFFLVELVIILTVLLSSIGIHQVVTVTTLGLTLQPDVLGLVDITYALTLIASWISCMIISPFVPFNMLTAGLIKENPFIIGFQWNRNFGIAVIIFSGIYITLVNMIF